MKGLYTALVASAISGVFAAPSPVERAAVTPRAKAAAPCATNVSLLSGNAFASRTLHANAFYSSEVVAAASAIPDAALAAKALKVASIGTFQWMYVVTI